MSIGDCEDLSRILSPF